MRLPIILLVGFLVTSCDGPDKFSSTYRSPTTPNVADSSKIGTEDATAAPTPAPEANDTDPPPVVETAYDWRSQIQWTPTSAWAWSGNSYGSSFYNDVMNQKGQQRILQYEPSTNAHETMHMILAEMNNRTFADDQFIYYQGGQGAYLEEPMMHAAMIRAFVPNSVRQIASRYDLYLVTQVNAYFPNVLYQFDEWNAYVTNARVAMEMLAAGTWPQGQMQDEVDGAMDFLVFCSAAMLAVHENEPEYFESNEQIRAVYAMLAEQTMQLVKAGLETDEFSVFHARQLLTLFRDAPETEAIRKFLKGWLGDLWVNEVLM